MLAAVLREKTLIRMYEKRILLIEIRM